MSRTRAERDERIEMDDGALDDTVWMRGKGYRPRQRVYHNDRDCTHLNPSWATKEEIRSVSRGEAQDNSAPPCSLCVLNGETYTHGRSEHLKSLQKAAEQRQKDKEDQKEEQETDENEIKADGGPP